MLSQHESNTLISALRELYFKAREYNLVKRISSYRERTSSNIPHDISAPLHKQIEKLVHKARQEKVTESKVPVYKSTTQTKGAVTSPAREKVEIQNNQPEKINKEQVSKSKDHSDTVVKPYKISDPKKLDEQGLGEKLKASMWEHIHSAGMQARSNQVATAKMHIDIANHALKEAARYMSEEDYNVVCEEVNAALDEFKEIKSA